MSDTEFLNDSDQDVSESHSKFIEAVSQLDKGQRIKRAERSEPTLEVSEFHLVKSGISDKDAVQIQDLAKSLGRKGHHGNIIKKLETARKTAKVLPKPLEKPTAERIKRIAGYENAKKEMQKWNNAIWKNRTADHLTFPLPKLSIESQSNVRKPFQDRFRTLSELEKKLAALEPKEEEAEEKQENGFSLTLEELLQKRNEAARFRARQSYREAKANRQKKIKSKKFHRIQRHEKTRQQLKEFEELRKIDPDAALKKLELLDIDRAKERMTLRHKNTGQWAKNKLIKAKYDKDTRQTLAEQLSISRELTEKVRMAHDSDDDENEMENDVRLPASDNVNDDENPWMKSIQSGSEINEFVSSYRKYWDERNRTFDQSKNTNNVNITKKVEHRPQNTEPSVESEETTQNAKQDHAKNDIVGAVEAVSDLDLTVEKSTNRKSKIAGDTTAENNWKIDESSRLNDENSAKDKSARKCKKLTETSNTKKGRTKEAPCKASSTSVWEVESVTNEDNRSSDVVPNIESVSKLFDRMEEKIEDKLRSRLDSSKRKYGSSNSIQISDKKRRTDAGNKATGSSENDYKGLRDKSKVQRPIINEPLTEDIEANEPSQQDTDSRDFKGLTDLATANKLNVQPTKTNDSMEIDVNKYITVKPKYLNTQMPDVGMAGGTDALDDSETEDQKEQRNLMSEAFADDDVVDEFRKEKKEAIKSSESKDTDDPVLPGWGTWAGPSTKNTYRKKRRRLIANVPKDAPRRDDNKGDVIIYESGNEKIKKHQVKELPYPFASVKDFEASIRAPIGREFVTENIHKQLIEPAVHTKLGTVIEPLDESALVDKKDLKKIERLEKNKSKQGKKQNTKR